MSSSALNQTGLFTESYRTDGALQTQAIDDAGVSGIVNPGTTTVSYTYTAAGRMLERSESGAEANATATTRTYDSNGMEATDTTPGITLSTFQYDAEGARLGFVYSAHSINGAGLYAAYADNARGELTSWPPPSGTTFPVYYADGVQAHVSDEYAQMTWDDRMAVIIGTNSAVSGTTTKAFDAAGRMTFYSGESLNGGSGWGDGRTYDAENHTLSTTASYYVSGIGGSSSESSAVSWGPNGHPILVGSNEGATVTASDTLHWNGNALLFTTNPQGQVDDIKIGAEGDILPLDTGYGGLTFYDRDPSGGAMGCHNSTGATFIGADETYEHTISGDGQGKQINLSVPISPCTTDTRYAVVTGSPSTPTGVMWWTSPLTDSLGGHIDVAVMPKIGQGGVLGMPRSDGYADGTDLIQGTRTYDSSAGTWTTPDAYQGDVDDPASQKSYMWNDNDPESYADPSGYNSYLYYDANCGDSCDAAPPTDTGTKTPQDSNDSKGPTQQSTNSAGIATQTVAQDGGGQQKGTGGSYGENSYSDRIAGAARQYEASGASTRGLYGAPTGNECVAALQKVLEIAVLSQMLGSNGRILLGVPAFVQALLSSGYAQVATPVAGDIVDLSGVHVGVYLGGNEMVSNSSTPGTFTWKDTPEHENATAAKQDGVPIGPITYYHHEP